MQIPIRTALKGSFPLNGTYFQVNEVNKSICTCLFIHMNHVHDEMEGNNLCWFMYIVLLQVFADHESSYDPIIARREWIWKLPKVTVYIGTSTTTMFRGKWNKPFQKMIYKFNNTHESHKWWKKLICFNYNRFARNRYSKKLCGRYDSYPNILTKK